MDQKQFHKDYYYILGVSPDATSSEISHAYNELSEKCGPHISVSGQDPEMLIKNYKEITEAYEVLGDPERRRNYDEQTHSQFQRSHLRQLWGKLSGEAAEEKKSDAMETRIEVEVTLKEAVKGTRKNLNINEPLPCQNCTGLKPVNRLQCPNCHGTGYSHLDRIEEIEFAPGLYDKLEVHKSNKGKYDIRSGKRGNLCITIKVLPHSFFQVLGRDVACTVPISLYEALLGGEIEIPTITGRVVMKIQPLTPSGKVYRLRGMGLAGADLLATVEVEMPKQLSWEEISHYRQLQELSKEPNPRDEIFKKLSTMS
jgi:DnaJ-class molecular chaperone